MPNRSRRIKEETSSSEESSLVAAVGDKSSSDQALHALKNFRNWMTELESLGESVFESDTNWLQEVVGEVRSLVSGRAPESCPTLPEEEEVPQDSKKTKTEVEDEEDVREVPVLLPKTPKLKSKRKTLKRKSQEEPPSSSSPEAPQRKVKVHKAASPTTSHLRTTTITYADEAPTTAQEDEQTQGEEVKTPPKVTQEKIEENVEEVADEVESKDSQELLPPSTVSSKEEKPFTPPQQPAPQEGPCDSTFVLKTDTPVKTTPLRRSLRLSVEKEASPPQSSKENCMPDEAATDVRRSKRLVKQTGDNREPLADNKTSARSSLSQYKGLVNKAIRTSISADQKRNMSEAVKDEEAVSASEHSKFTTPLSQTRGIVRAFSASTYSGMKTTSVIQRSHSSVRHRSPLPTKVSSSIAKSSRVFLSSKSTSKLDSKTRFMGPSNIVRGLTSFLPQKPPPEDPKVKQEEELRRKQQKEEEAIHRKEEIARLKMEEKKSLREARLKKVLENKKMLKKQPSLTDLRKHEMQSKSTAKLMQQQAEEKKALKEREEKEKEEKAALRKLEILKMQQEKKKLLEAQKKLEAQKLAESKAMEEAKLCAAAKAAALKKVEKPPMLNVTVTKDLPSTSSSTNSYDMTPAPEDLPPVPLRDEDNYDVGDLKSDDDTDDEDQPRKAIPKWACGALFRQALTAHCYYPPDTDSIFANPPMPNLDIIFPLKKRRFFKRTSSAVWAKAPIHE